MPKFVEDEGRWKRDHSLWERKWQETRDVRYVTLAIGRALAIASTNKIAPTLPDWAVEACTEYFESFDKNHFDPLVPKKGGPKGFIEHDDRMLDEMALLTLGGETLNAAAELVTGEGFEHADVHRLTKKWRVEWGDHPNRKNANEHHPRELRVLRRSGSFLYPRQS